MAFALMGLVGHAALAWVYVLALQDHKAIRTDRLFLKRAPAHIPVLVVGDSHPRTAIDGRRLGRGVVNIASGGEHYLKTWYRVRWLLGQTHSRVDTLILPLDAASFSSWHATNFAPEYVWGRYVDYLEVGRVRGDTWAYVPRWLKASFFPYAGELRTLAQMRSNRFGFGEDLPTGSFGALGRAEQRNQAMEQAKIHLKGADVLDPALAWAFARLVRWTADNHIRLVLVSYPVTADYYQWVERTPAPLRVRTEIALPLGKRRPDVLQLDYHDRFFGRNDLFSDPHHLNPAGRAEFTRILRRDLVAAGVMGGDAPKEPTDELAPDDPDEILGPQ